MPVELPPELSSQKCVEVLEYNTLPRRFPVARFRPAEAIAAECDYSNGLIVDSLERAEGGVAAELLPTLFGATNAVKKNEPRSE